MNVYRLYWDDNYRNPPDQIEAETYRFRDVRGETTSDNIDGLMLEFLIGNNIVATFVRFPVGITLAHTT